MKLTTFQRYMPARLKFFLKPYYRKVFRNTLHILFYPTFRCNYLCSYCPVHTKFDMAKVFPRAKEKSAAEWIAVLEKLPPAMIYIAGGEPFLYPELAELVNRLPSKHQVLGIVSNASLPLGAYQKVIRRVHLNASFHREFVSADALLPK